MTRARRLLLLALLVLIGVPWVLRLVLVPHRGFGPDELEHSHFAWRMLQGELPYRDYFEHHTPFFHVLLRGLYSLRDVTRSGDEAIAALFDARRMAWAFGGLALFVTFLLGRFAGGVRAGLVAALLLGNTGVFLWRGFESRPDVPAMGLVTLALYLAARGLATLGAGAATWGALAAAGLALGAATMFTQKVLFFGPGIALFCLLLLLEPRLRASRASRLTAIALLGGGFLIPILLTLAFFAASGALREFVECNFLLNARWPGLAARDFVMLVLADDAPVAALCFAGLWLRRARPDAEALGRGEPFLALALLSPVACLLVHPAVTLHYFLLFLPAASVYAACALVAAAEAAARRLPRLSADALLAAAAVALSLAPALRLREAYTRGNWSTLQGIRFVLANTAPWEPTLDGFSGLGAFRPAAFYYPFVNSHTRFLMGPDRSAEITGALRSGRVAPRLLFMTQDLREGLEPEALRHVERHYAEVHLEPIRARLFDGGAGWWRDEGPRPLGWTRAANTPHVFVGDGWRIPAEADGVAVRRTRARRSVLLLPLRRPGPGRLVLRARADAEGLPFAFNALANGRELGRAEAVDGWHEYAFDAPAGALRIGFNAIALRFAPIGGPAERRTELAVEWIAFERASPEPDAATADAAN